MRRKIRYWSIVALLFACCLGATISLTPTPSAHAATHSAQVSALGGLNLSSYCQSFGYTNATTIGTTVYDWVCIDAVGDQAHIDMTNACHWQYGPNSIDYFTNFYDAGSILCGSVTTLRGGINMRGYCQSIGYTNVTTVGTTADAWRCIAANGGLATINMAWACVYQYGTVNVLDRSANFYSVTSWQCWG